MKKIAIVTGASGGIRKEFVALMLAEKSCKTIQVEAIRGLADAKKGKDVSVCTLYIKYMRFLSKIFPHNTVMRTWIKSVSKYLKHGLFFIYRGG